MTRTPSLTSEQPPDPWRDVTGPAAPDPRPASLPHPPGLGHGESTSVLQCLSYETIGILVFVLWTVWNIIDTINRICQDTHLDMLLRFFFVDICINLFYLATLKYLSCDHFYFLMNLF